MIRLENLSVAFHGTEVVKNVNLEIADGEIVGIVGESGSGKSVTALTLMGLVSREAVITSGRIFFKNTILAEAGKERNRELYRSYQGSRMSMVFQEPMTSLNPTQRVGRQVEEMLLLHTDLKADERKEKVYAAFTSVGLKNPKRVYNSYPHQLSGGMRQRAMIAMAILLHPELIVADEPTTALDAAVQEQIVELLRRINREQKNAMLFITHDLNLAKRLCSRIAVMKDGKVVETGRTDDIFAHPAQEYTKRLIWAVPSQIRKKTARLADAEPVLEVENLSVFYQEGSNSLFGRTKKHCVVEDASFVIKKGEVLGLVGESGCGKTSLSRAILGMNRDIQGKVVHHCGGPQMIFQDPYSSLNPAKTIGWLLQEPLRAQAKREPSCALSKLDMEASAYDMLHRVGLPESCFHRKPASLSGGQRQRVSIGQALITHPGLVIADEPVSALDVTTQVQIIELMQELQEELGLSCLFISHDRNVICRMSDRIMVMRAGKIISTDDADFYFHRMQET